MRNRLLVIPGGMIVLGMLLLGGNAHAQRCNCSGPSCGVDAPECRDSGSSSSSRSSDGSRGTGSSGSASNAAVAEHLIQGIGNILLQSVERREREYEQERQRQMHEQQQRASAEQERKRQFAQMEQAVKERRRKMLASADGSAQGNPWAEGSGTSAGNGGGSAQGSFERPDPDQDLAGQGCAFFTCPHVRADGGGINAYAPGAFVIYGKWSYECSSDRRWINRGPASVWLPQNENNRAEKLEHGCK